MAKRLIENHHISFDDQNNLQISTKNIKKVHEWKALPDLIIPRCELLLITENTKEDLYLKLQNHRTKTQRIIPDRWSPKNHTENSEMQQTPLSIQERIDWFKNPRIIPWIKQCPGSYQIENVEISPPWSQLSDKAPLTENSWAITLLNIATGWGHAALLIEILFQTGLLTDWLGCAHPICEKII